MGNNLSVLINGKVVAALARKHNFCFYGENHLPDEDEIDKTLSDTRQHITSTLVGYATWLATQKNPLTENIDDIVSSVKDLIEVFEHEVMVAGRNWVLRDLQDQVDVDEGFCGDRPNFIEVIDDNELYRRQEIDKKYDEDKLRYFENLRNNLEKNTLQEAIDAQHPLEFWDEEALKDELDLLLDEDDFEKDTLVGKEWEYEEDDYLDRQNRN